MVWIGLLIALTVLTLVGHFIWVVAAAILGFKVRTTRPGKSATELPPRNATDGLARVTVNLTRLLNEGLITAATHARLVSAIEAEQRRLALPPLSQVISKRRTPPPIPVLPVEVDDAEAMSVLSANEASTSSSFENSPIAELVMEEALAGELSVEEAKPPTLPPVVAPPFLPPPIPRPPRRTFPEMIASFLEESNIRWGELIGGMLIVGCSVALVISFWADISRRPWLEFSVFTAVTAALFGMGLYAEHRWKLPNTSRGILIIATLLVPLNFLAFAAFSRGTHPGVITLCAELFAFALFTYLVWQAAKAIAPFWPQILAAGSCSLSAFPLVLGCIDIGPVDGLRFYLLAFIPLGCYAGAIVWMLARARRWRTIRAHAANSIFILLGTSTFATMLALGLLIHRSGQYSQALRHLALPLSLAGLPALATGLLLWRRVTVARLAMVRIAGTTIAILGAGVLLGGLAVAWPAPHEILTVAIFDFVALTVIALLYEVAPAHWLALPCGAIAWIFGFHLLRAPLGDVVNAEQLMRVLSDPLGGTALVPLVVLLVAARQLFGRFRRSLDAHIYGRFAIATAIGSLVWVTWAGFGRSPDLYACTWVYGLYAAMAFVIAWRTLGRQWSWTGWFVLGCAIVQAFTSHRLTSHPWEEALLAFSTLGCIADLLERILARYRSAAPVAAQPGTGEGQSGAAIPTQFDTESQSSGNVALDAFRKVRGRPKTSNDIFQGIANNSLLEPARWLAVAAATLAIIVAIARLQHGISNRPAADIAWAAIILLVIALANDITELFVAGQIVSAGAIVLAAVIRIAPRPWFMQSEMPGLEPWTIQILAISLAAVCLFWKLLRQATVLPRRIANTLSGAAPFDQALSFGLLFILVGLVLSSIIPAIRIEFDPWASAIFGPEQFHAIGQGSWILLALVALALAIDTRETPGLLLGVALPLTFWSAAPLLAARLALHDEAASALRWLCGAYCLIGFIPRNLTRVVGSSSSIVRATVFALGAGTIFLLTMPAVVMAIGGVTYGPLSTSFLGHMGRPVSYAVPLAILAVIVVIEGTRERSARNALAASGLFCLTATVAYLLSLGSTHRWLGSGEIVRLLQINAMVMAGFAAAWLAVRDVASRPERDEGNLPPILIWQIRIALLLNAVILAPAAVCLALSPNWASTFIGEAGGFWGWAALVCAIVAAIASGSARRDRLTVRTLALAALALPMLAATSVAAFRPFSGWTAFHTMLGGDILAAYGLLALGWWIVGDRKSVFADEPIQPEILGATEPVVLNYERPSSASEKLPVWFGGQLAETAIIRWASAVGLIVLALAVRALAGDPAAPWWSMGAAVFISILAVGIAGWGRRPAFLYPAALLLNFAAATWFLYRGWSGGWSGLDFVSTQVIAAAIPGIAWLVLARHLARDGIPFAPRRLPAVHHAAAIGSSAIAILLCGTVIASRLTQSGSAYEPALVLLAILSAIALMAACLWDSKARYALPGLYALGLATALYAVSWMIVSPRWLPWAMVIALAGYVIASSAMFFAGARIGRLARSVGIETGVIPVDSWLPPLNTIAAAMVLVATGVIDFSLEPTWLRAMVAAASLSQTLSLGLLAARLPSRQNRAAALCTFTLGVVLFGWALLPVGQPESIDRCAIAFIGISAVAFFSGPLLRRIFGEESLWSQTVQESTIGLLALAAVALLATLVAEGIGSFHSPAMRMHIESMAVLLTLLIASAMTLKIAAWPGPSSRLTDRQRLVCVYAAEGLLTAAIIHLLLAEPQLFRGFLRPYWPLVVMSIAFAGVGVAEVFRRQGNRILSEPLEQTGIFLPLLPAIGWWVAPAAHVDYGFLLLIVALFYAILASIRRSLPLATLATLAANGAIWDALAQYDSLAFARHPQLWLIPASLSLLAGAQLNCDRLPPIRLRAIRYICLMAIYVSSTADIFIAGVDKAPWLPLVLAGLSVTGVFIGLLLRIRPFLFLGSGFLFLSVITMIYFASSELHWTWIWYVGGIALGSGILVLFGLFERKRESMLAVVEGLRGWE